MYNNDNNLYNDINQPIYPSMTQPIYSAYANTNDPHTLVLSGNIFTIKQKCI
jgi:hypothetical protein